MKVQFREPIQPLAAQNKPNFEASPKKFLMQETNVDDHLQALNNYGKYIAFRGKIPALKELSLKPGTDVGQKLEKLRAEMKKADLDALIVRSTDEYLNETVDKNQSQRIYISDFTGSAGDILITQNNAFLIVDSRYHTQAGKEVDPDYYTVEKVGLDPSGNKIDEYPYERLVKVIHQLAIDGDLKIGYDPNKFSVNSLQVIENSLKGCESNVELIPTEENLVDKVRGGKPPSKVMPVRVVPVSLIGETTTSKMNRLKNILEKDQISVMVISDLFDISYLTNLRGADIDYNAAFKAKAFAAGDKLYVFCDPSKISPQIKKELKDNVIFKPEEAYSDTLEEVIKQADEGSKIAYSGKTTNYDTYLKLKELASDEKPLHKLEENPIALMRSIKNDTELASMKDSMNRADRAVADVIEWINKKIKDGKKISEKDLEDKMREAHFRHGANALSFEIIPGSGPNGAIVHYSKGDPDKLIEAGELILLDTGGYYESGYATDLTRSWLAGDDFGVKYLRDKDPEDLKKKKIIYSTVLKGALQGLFAELPPGATGQYLDNLCRKPIQDQGYDFGHSVGHGVGIGVHESPPSITPGGAGKVELKEGMVFSIEPGIYIEGWGGVRFENLVTVKKHDDPEKAKQGWKKIECLTFAPIDHNLLDESILDKQDLQHIADFDKKVKITMKETKPDEKSLEL